MSFFLQASWLLAALLLFLPSEARAQTARQQEILRELEVFRPEGAELAAGAGVWMLSRWDTDGELSRIVSLPVGGGNAARYFKMLEEYYPSEKAALAGGGEDSAGVDALLRAAEEGGCSLSPEYYPEAAGPGGGQPDFQILREYLQALLRRAERSAARGDGRDAERCFRAALVCGKHLTDDKSSSLVFVTGLIFKVRGAQALQNYLVRAGDAARAALLRGYSERLAVLMRAFMWKANVALSEFAAFACLPAVVRIAREDVESFWRKEAVFRLAALRYGVVDAAAASVARDPALERLADETLEWVAANDADASVRRMAVWAALNVSPQGYAGMRQWWVLEEFPEPPAT